MIDLNKGINLQIQGELGRFNTLPIDALVKIAEHLQTLINSIAVHGVDKGNVIDLSNFKLELSAFRTGSAVPEFKFTPRVQGVVAGNIEQQRKAVNRRLDNLMKISSSGQFDEIKKLYRNPSERNEIVLHLCDFLHSFKNAPVSVVEVKEGEIVKPVYKLKRLNQETKNSLLTEVRDAPEEYEVKSTEAVGRIRVITTGKSKRNRVEEVFPDKTLSYSPDTIVHDDHVYVLNFPLRCLFIKEEDFCVIKNELLDIIGTGKTADEAEANFAEEFHYIYSRYNELSDDELTARIRGIKTVLKLYVKSVES